MSKSESSPSDKHAAASKAHDNYKLWSPQPDPATIAKCPICNSRAEVWQYSAKPDSQLLRVVMCTNGEAFGPQIRDGAAMGGCILYMPPDDFYRARTKEAVQYWNEYAEALLAARSAASTPVIPQDEIDATMKEIEETFQGGTERDYGKMQGYARMVAYYRQSARSSARTPATCDYCKANLEHEDHKRDCDRPSSVSHARTPADYAIEHGEYLAEAAEHFLAAYNRVAQMELDADHPPELSDYTAAEESRSESYKGLTSAIHEFRKRAERAMNTLIGASATRGSDG